MKPKKNPNPLSDYLKSNRKGSREAELMISVGWTAKDRPHKNKHLYDRKSEKRNWQNDNSNSAFSFGRIKLSLHKILNSKKEAYNEQ